MESYRRQLNVSLISARIIRGAYYYATIMGVICFRLRRSEIEDRFVAQNCCWHKWFCIILRIVVIYAFTIKHGIILSNWNLSQAENLIYIRRLGCLAFFILILVFELFYGKQMLHVTNGYLRIFRRVKALSVGKDMSFGGNREFTLLLFKIISLICELHSTFLTLYSRFETHSIIALACETYIGLCTALVSHICFLGYLSVGALYDRTNSYVRNELRQQLQDLDDYRGGQPSRRRLRDAKQRLDECLDIYDEIQRVAMSFHRLFELVLGLFLLFGFANMALVAYFALLQLTFIDRFWLVGGKILVDLLVLILAIHGAGCSSRVVRRLSLENYYVCEQSDWNMKLEMFLNRLNYYEFRVCPLGLFEVSNELILVFLSAMVTYLTYVLQYSVQSV